MVLFGFCIAGIIRVVRDNHRFIFIYTAGSYLMLIVWIVMLALPLFVIVVLLMYITNCTFWCEMICHSVECFFLLSQFQDTVV